MNRALILAAVAVASFALGHVALTTALAIPELTARAAAEASW